MGDPNPKVSAINLYLRSVVKMGMMKIKQNTRSIHFKETLTTLPAIIVIKRTICR